MTSTLFDHDMDHRHQAAERRTIRRLVLAGVLQGVRGRRDWSVNDAASAASIAPMTWRRLEDGLDVRRRSLTAVDGLLGLPFGTTSRALDDDELMVDLLRRIGQHPPAELAADDYLGALADRARSAAAPRRTYTIGQEHLTDVRTTPTTYSAVLDPQTMAGLAATREALAAAVDAVRLPISDITRAAELAVSMHRRAVTPAIERAVRALLDALPDLVTADLTDSIRAADLLVAIPDYPDAVEAAVEVARAATARAIEAGLARQSEPAADPVAE